MSRFGRVLLATICLLLPAVPLLRAQNKNVPAVPPAPVPQQILTAKKVFISNAGGESFEKVIDQKIFNGGPDRPYNEFYDSVQSWGHFEIVGSPADADLVLQISWVIMDTGLKLPVLGQIHLTLIDPKTRVTLWNIMQYVRGAILLSNRDKNFEQSMTIVMNRLKGLAEPSNKPADTN